MILGILSDTHGQHERAARAIDLLTRLGAEAFVHCGDVGGERVLDTLVGLRAWFVWGNTDVVDRRLLEYVADAGLRTPETVPTRVFLDDTRISVFHGHEPGFARIAALAESAADLKSATGVTTHVLFGHTHKAFDQTLAGVRFINPGALHRAAAYTVATLDTLDDTLCHWRIDAAANTLLKPQRHFLG